MTACILVVDDVPANVKLLQARLTAEFFEVKSAANGAEALAICAAGGIDLVLLDVMMPGMDGFEVCELLKADPVTAAIPVVMVTALDQPSDRVRGLKAGADDFLTKPVNDMQLMARVKSLVRLKRITDELSQRQASIRSMFEAVKFEGERRAAGPARFLVVDERHSSGERMARMLAPLGTARVETDPQGALLIAADMQPDCILISLGFADFDALRLCTQLRALDRTRALPIMVVTDEGDGERIARALDIGVNDYVARPCDEQEVVARARTQLRNKRAMERLRHTVLQTAVPTLTDPATGTNSRHFLDNHLPALLERCRARGHALSLIVAELDASHDGNDAVLAEFARRILSAVRPADLVCRFAGTQFAVAMANTDAESAWRIAERIRHAVTEMPFAAGAGSPLAIAVSSGVATADAASTDVSSLVARTLAALEKARNSGRNRVAAEAA